MKTKPMVTILVSVLAAGLASAQSPSIIQNTRNTMNGVSNNATAASNEALGIRQSTPATTSATHAPSKSSGVRVFTPVKPSSPRPGARKRVSAVAVMSSAPAKPSAEVPKSNPPAVASVAGNGATGSGEVENEQPVVPDSKYAALNNCRWEIEQAEKLMRREGIRWLSSTTKSIEEIAATLMQTIKLERHSY